MKTATSISGGKTSAYLAANYPTDLNIFSLVRTSDKNCLYPDKKLRQIVSDKIGEEFIGTLEEDEIILTIIELEQFLGKEITWVTGPTFDELIIKKSNYLPNKVSRYCTTELKTIPIATYLYEAGLNPVSMAFGYRANEQGRAKTMDAKRNEDGIVEAKIIIGKHPNGNNKWKTIDYQKPCYPLIQDGIYRDTIHNYWEGKSVTFAVHNNCVGCWWRDPIMLNHKSKSHPNKMNWFSNQEKITGNRFKTEMTYKEIIKHKMQTNLFDSDFNDCDSGYCGV